MPPTSVAGIYMVAQYLLGARSPMAGSQGVTSAPRRSTQSSFESEFSRAAPVVLDAENNVTIMPAGIRFRIRPSEDAPEKQR